MGVCDALLLSGSLSETYGIIGFGWSVWRVVGVSVLVEGLLLLFVSEGLVSVLHG